MTSAAETGAAPVIVITGAAASDGTGQTARRLRVTLRALLVATTLLAALLASPPPAHAQSLGAPDGSDGSEQRLANGCAAGGFLSGSGGQSPFTEGPAGA